MGSKNNQRPATAETQPIYYKNRYYYAALNSTGSNANELNDINFIEGINNKGKDSKNRPLSPEIEEEKERKNTSINEYFEDHNKRTTSNLTNPLSNKQIHPEDNPVYLSAINDSFNDESQLLKTYLKQGEELEQPLNHEERVPSGFNMGNQ